MRAVLRALGPGLVLVGLALLAYALRTGGARLYLLVIVPVITGTAPFFFLAVACLVVGVLFLPLAFVAPGPPELVASPAGSAPATPAADSERSGGLILIGPVPLFFGAWRRNPPISYRWAVLVGVVLAVVAVLLLWGLAVL